MIDEKIHQVSEFFKNCKFENIEPYINKKSVYEFYYAENELYVLRTKYSKEYSFIKAKSPKEAYEKMLCT